MRIELFGEMERGALASFISNMTEENGSAKFVKIIRLDRDEPDHQSDWQFLSREEAIVAARTQKVYMVSRAGNMLRDGYTFYFTAAQNGPERKTARKNE